MSDLAPIEKIVDFETPVFSRAFVVVDLFPSLALIASVAAVLMSGAPGRVPSGARFAASLAKVTTTSVLLCFGVAFLLAAILHPVSLRLRRILSGYSTLVILAPLLSLLRWRQRKRFATANHRIDARVTRDRIARARWTEIFSRELPAPDYITPSRLGNALEALRSRTERELSVEDVISANSDSAQSYRTAYLRARDEKLTIASALDDCRLKIAAAERYTLVWAIVGLTYLWLLGAHGWWLLLALAAFAMSRLAYLGAVQCVVEYSYRIDDLLRITSRLPSDPPPDQPIDRSA